MSACPSCSADNSDTSKFCSECGAALSPEFAATVTPETSAEQSNAPSSLSESSHHGRFLPGTRIADRYRIVSLVGKGGMGEVYRADDLECCRIDGQEKVSGDKTDCELQGSFA